MATKVVMLTSPGRGAVASLLVEGPRATDVVGQQFHPRGGPALAELPSATLRLGRWQSPHGGEEVIVRRHDAQRVEIHCHGGRAAAEAITASLVKHGCEEVDWRAWTFASTVDPIEAAALVALASAPTERTAAILLDQAQGALRRAIDELGARIAAGEVPAALERVDALLARRVLGSRLIEPWKVVLAGRPNVGKSSLINALLGYERAIVDRAPGTTRDVVTSATALEGWPVELSDTAGLHASTDPLEESGMRLAQSRLAGADLVVLVFDASTGLNGADASLADDWPGALHVYNKSDLMDQGHVAGADARLLVSAKAGSGISDLERELVQRLVPYAPSPADAVPFAPQHVATFRRIREALSSRQLDKAGQLVADPKNWIGQAC